MRYEIDENLTVRVWVEQQEEPMLLQPFKPDGQPFKDHEDAEDWANRYVAYFQNPENLEFPDN
jgi:hypothetical protein